MNQQVYIVTAYRYGDRERHSYVVTCCSTLKEAEDFAKKEEELRAGKYSCEVIEVPMAGYQDTSSFKIVRRMKEFHSQLRPTKILVEVLGGVVICLKTTNENVELYLVDHDCIKEHEGYDLKETIDQVTTTPVTFDEVVTNPEFKAALNSVMEDYLTEEV